MLKTIKSNDLKIGDFVLTKDLRNIFEIVRSGNVMQSFAPDVGIMRCYKQTGKKGFEVNELTEDYFNSEFYGPFTKIQADRAYEIIKENIGEVK